MFQINGRESNSKFHPRTGHESPEGEQRYSPTLSLTSVLDGGGLSTPHHSYFTPGKETRYPLYKRLDEPQGQFVQVWKISPSPGFDLQTVQPVLNHYSDYAHNEREEDTEFLKLAHKVVSSTHVYEMG